MASFFIDRPVFAWVLAIIVMLTGAMSLTQLPVAVYPKLAPPSVAINASYPGASAKTLEDIYSQVTAEDHLYQKIQLVQQLKHFGIMSILTRPENLTVDTINKYLELKSRGLI